MRLLMLGTIHSNTRVKSAISVHVMRIHVLIMEVYMLIIVQRLRSGLVPSTILFSWLSHLTRALVAGLEEMGDLRTLFIGSGRHWR